MDPNLQAAIEAIQCGDFASLRQLLADYPNLVHERAVDSQRYPPGYFHEPRLLWFVANNPILIEKMPSNMVQIAEAIMNAGADPADIDYTLELVMTGRSPRENKLQRPLMNLLLDRGAKVTIDGIYMTLGHGERDAIEALLQRGQPMTAAIAAGTGRTDELARLIRSANREELQAALSVAVINKQLDSARLCLSAGADPNQFMPVHRHSVPLHQAAWNDDVPMMKLLVDHGATADIRDTMWNGTPLEWANHGSKGAAQQYLRATNEKQS